LERRDEVELDRYPRRYGGLGDLHAAAADVLVADPLVDGAGAAPRTTEGPLHGGVALLVGRPRTPALEVVDQREDLFGRRLDLRAPRDAKIARLGGRVAEHGGDGGDDDDEN